MNATDNKYEPYEDLDKNGVIIVTPFNVVGRNPAHMYFMNISGQFNGKGLHPGGDPDRVVNFDFQNCIDKLLAPESMRKVVGFVEQLYSNEIDSLCFRNLPNMNYDVLAGTSTAEMGAVQWERSDLNKLIGHLRMLYDSTLTKQ